ncbi:uncharacterized protein LACBIDRAFT_331454 [Laccaria bicolor S238N-H82]|uniref:Predicted protein n=1 Tax=Laccaria bicolor (strain S238N-H82 / ATCC MYA-4686) TaxID=486041 RepID=B0DPI8_LACBS|nr:uncharacterized protein LACBIDRAFT_331454 [Laccaria bicolor S238N-H82]EDR03385.1 predicted protein [Laccaria bicolor S238N-H82]|eukprot:XP_001885841.1 predicted protein [Laccaria bicolor S238N-H82]
MPRDSFPPSRARVDRKLPHFDLTNLLEEHVYLPIMAIDLLVVFDHQGICDERNDLSVPRPYKQRFAKDPPRANHFAIWFTFDKEYVGIDIVQENVPVDAYLNPEPEKESARGVVRIASKKSPTEDNIGCVMRDPRPMRPITIDSIIRLISSRGLHKYLFRPVHKQQAGCRYWMSRFARVLEEEGICSQGFQMQVDYFLGYYHNRPQVKTAGGRYKDGGSWGPRLDMECARIIPGEFYYEQGKNLEEHPEKGQDYR